MKKVLFIATVDSHIKHFHIPYLKYFKELGYEVHVATGEDGEIEYCDRKITIPIKRNPIKIGNLKAIKQLKKEIEKEKYDIIHCHTPMGSVITRIAAKKARKKYNTKVFYTAHGFHFYKGAPLLNWIIYYPVEKWLSKHTDCLITINQEDYKLASKKFKANKIELVHGVGVDENKFDFEMTKEQRNELRKGFELEEDDFVLIQIGELNKNKNQIMSIDAMKELVVGNPKIKLLLVGKGELEEYYRQKIDEYNLQNNIHMLGYRTDIEKLLKISDCSISLSKREGLPLNLIEAMFCDLPIIATDCRGNRDIAKKTIGIGQIDLLCQNIKECMKSKEEYICVKVEEYKLKNVIKEVDKIYKDNKVVEEKEFTKLQV